MSLPGCRIKGRPELPLTVATFLQTPLERSSRLLGPKAPQKSVGCKGARVRICAPAVPFHTHRNYYNLRSVEIGEKKHYKTCNLIVEHPVKNDTRKMRKLFPWAGGCRERVVEEFYPGVKDLILE
jgi:hypothetical protein